MDATDHLGHKLGFYIAPVLGQDRLKLRASTNFLMDPYQAGMFDDPSLIVQWYADPQAAGCLPFPGLPRWHGVIRNLRLKIKESGGLGPRLTRFWTASPILEALTEASAWSLSSSQSDKLLAVWKRRPRHAIDKALPYWKAACQRNPELLETRLGQSMNGLEAYLLLASCIEENKAALAGPGTKRISSLSVDAKDRFEQLLASPMPLLCVNEDDCSRLESQTAYLTDDLVKQLSALRACLRSQAAVKTPIKRPRRSALRS